MSSDEGDTVDISSSGSDSENESIQNEEQQPHKELTRRDILGPIIHSTVSALGGVETDSQTGVTRYVLGDDCLGCLRDLKKLWRKDDTDDERTVARMFWETRVLENDLVPILIETAGGGAVGDKRAVACADVIGAMTWPIDIAAELKELDEQLDERTDYATLILAQLHYKEALARPEALKALQNVMMPCIAKDKRSRTERDIQIISLVLYIFRNLLLLKDPPRTTTSLSSSTTSLASLQSRLLVSLRTTGLLDLFLTCASNADTPEFSEFSAVLLEITYLIIRGVGVRDVARVKEKVTKNGEGRGMLGDGEDEQLKALLDQEKRRKRIANRGAPTRHSRFGTTVAIKTNKEMYVLHRQEAITADPSEMIDMVKKKRAKKIVRVNEVGVFNSLSSEALAALAMFAGKFVESCFNTFMSCVLKDIKLERPKYTEKDNLRLLFLTKWFLEFFLLVRENQEKERKQRALFAGAMEVWPFGYVSEVVEHGRMRAAVEEKPKLWVELQAGMDCLTQLLNLIVLMAQDPDEATQEAAETLQHQLYYNGEALDVALDSLRNYKDQSIAYLDSAVHLAYVLLRMLEKWAHSQGEIYVRKRKKKSRAKKVKGVSEEEGIVDVESDEDEGKAAEDLVKEQMFVFEKYEAKFAQEDIAHSCLVYLARWREFTSSEQMRRVVGLLHRQAVKAKAEGFSSRCEVSTLSLFQSILKNQASLPKDQPHKDLTQLINFILRKFFKSAQEHPLLLIEAFYPKNRGQWKAYSSYEPEVKPKSKPAGKAEVGVKKGFKTSEQIGIAVDVSLARRSSVCLTNGRVQILKRVGRQRQAIVEETDASEEPPSDEDEEAAAARQAALQKKVPSAEAMDKFEEYRIPYLDDQQSEAATSNKYLKLLMRLVGFTCTEDDTLEPEWHVPKQLTPSELQTSQNVIEQYLANPLDLQGKKAKDHLTTKRGTRRQRDEPDVSSSSSEDSKGLSDSAGEDFLPNDEASVQKRAERRAAREERRAAKRQRREERESKKRERKKKEVQIYKSAEIIEDSDAELGDDDAFFAKEKELMEKAKQAGQGTYASGTMLEHGTKKRKNKEGGKKKKGKRAVEASKAGADAEASAEEADGQNDSALEDVRPAARPRPRPRPRPKPTQPSPSASPKSVVEDVAAPSSEGEEPAVRPRPRPRPRIPVESDEE
ncbi:timeless protein-domain-containing protein [Rhizoctonia solani]|nr:timeless protein-domain-containing protein [Rhizoctonia solani]